MLLFRKSIRVDLIERLIAVERRVKSFEDDLVELEDRTRRWMQRTLARQRADDPATPHTPSGDETAPPADAVSAAIHRRRGRLGNNLPKLPTDD